MSSSPETITIDENYAQVVTAQLIGSLLNFFFFGTLLIQVYVYRLCFPKDSLAVKCLVYFIFLAMTACTCLNAVDAEFWFGDGFGDIERFSDPRNSRIYVLLFGSFIALLVQLFFACRILTIQRAAWPLPLLVSIIALAQCAGGMGAGIVSYLDNSDNKSRDRQRTILVYLWLVAGAAADVLIAGTMTCFMLASAVVSAPRDIVKSAVRLVIETNVFSTVVALLGLVLYVGVPHTTYWVCPTMILPGIYANTLLIALNNRAIGRLDASPPRTASTSLAFSSHGHSTYNNRDSESGASANTVTKVGRSHSHSLTRVLSVPAMSFARREDMEEKPRGSLGLSVRDDEAGEDSVEPEEEEEEQADTESAYVNDSEGRV
ncbi:hypothetical protein B0H19DRAFT_1367666 [Mycena capillaripes]|nr:hypothetical protein B0H19DRAFT_1367666 [Mycena capillaripes]